VFSRDDATSCEMGLLNFTWGLGRTSMTEGIVAPSNLQPDNNGIPRNRPARRLTVRDPSPGSALRRAAGAFASMPRCQRLTLATAGRTLCFEEGTM